MKYYPMLISCIGRRMFASTPTMSFSLPHYAPPPPKEVHFWYLYPEEVQDTTLFNAYKGLLSSEEYMQVLQMKGKQLQKQSLLARVLVGIDVEEKGRKMSSNILTFARRYFSLPEITWLEAFTDPEKQRQQFIQLWTLKEAYVKALGRGISGSPFKDFTIHLKHSGETQDHLGQYGDIASHSHARTITLEVLRNTDAPKTNWQFLLFEPTNSHYASVCVEQNENDLQEDERNQMSCSGLKMNIWKTVPLVKDESLSGKQAILAFSNSANF